MDPDALQDEVDAWVRDGIITESQAETILDRYEDTDDGGRSRAVVALSVVGSALVLVGVTLFLATNWEELPTGGQVAVLLGGPGLAYAGGVAAYRRALPRIGLACSLLGAVLAGPSVFLLADLAAVEIARAWLLLAWTSIALPTGHALDSRAGVGIGLAVLTGLVAELAGTADPIPSVAFLGIGSFALADLQRDRTRWTYRTGGAILALLGALLLTTLEGNYGGFTVEPTAILFTTVLGSLAGVGWLQWRGDRHGTVWAGTAVVGIGVATGLAALAPDRLPETAAFLGGHVAMLVVVAATGYFGYRSDSRRFIDLAAVAALGQTLSFVAATVVDALSGSVALVVAGLMLLGSGVALERGRRTLLARLDGEHR
jgi:uncharacterized membrane protein